MHAITSILPHASTTCRIPAERTKTRAITHTYPRNHWQQWDCVHEARVQSLHRESLRVPQTRVGSPNERNLAADTKTTRRESVQTHQRVQRKRMALSKCSQEWQMRLVGDRLLFIQIEATRPQIKRANKTIMRKNRPGTMKCTKRGYQLLVLQEGRDQTQTPKKRMLIIHSRLVRARVKKWIQMHKTKEENRRASHWHQGRA